MVIHRKQKEVPVIKVETIPANKYVLLKRQLIKKVAAYCRVSTDQEIQLRSLETQQEYYENLIKSKPGWEFVGIYADTASGLNNKKMLGFQDLMQDCRNGKIDLILIKSISRLGRNTVQFLNSCDELKALNVDVFFEVENIYISDLSATVLMTVQESMFQHESEEKSYNTRWGIRARFAEGTSKFANAECYGYRKNCNGELEVYEPEAEIIRNIYNWHDQGVSLRGISQKLSELGIKSPRGKDSWGIETIRLILNNEKYRGNVLLQKTFVDELFTKKRRPNEGEYPQYLIENHHEAIVQTIADELKMT